MIRAECDSGAEIAEACEDLVSWLDEPPSRPPAWPEGRWKLLREAAQVHGVAPLLHLRLEATAWRGGPLRTWLGEQYSANRDRVARMLAELRALLDLCLARQLDLMAMKGPVLLGLFDRGEDSRPMNDLDLLVRDRDLEDAAAVLEELGYRKVFEGWKHSKFLKPGNEMVVDDTREHPDNPRPVELHPLCRERLRDEVIDLTELMWSTARRGELYGSNRWLPSADALWLHLLVHTTHHVLLNTFRLSQLLDLDLLLPKVASPAELTASVDARATIPALCLLQKYFPRRRYADLLQSLLPRVGVGFADWAGDLDLYSASYLNPTPWRAD